MPCKITIKDTLFNISIDQLGPYLCPERLLNVFSNLHIPPCVGKIFKFMVFTFLENALNLGIFIHALSSQSKLSSNSYHQIFGRVGRGKLLICLAAFFRKSVPPNSRERWRKIWFDLSKLNQKIWSWLGTLTSNHDNLILKLHLKKSSDLDEMWFFIGRFKVGRTRNDK